MYTHSHEMGWHYAALQDVGRPAAVSYVTYKAAVERVILVQVALFSLILGVIDAFARLSGNVLEEVF